MQIMLYVKIKQKFRKVGITDSKRLIFVNPKEGTSKYL